MKNVTFDFSGKVVVVTGGASGIGKATVKMFAEAGANVVLVDNNKAKGQEVANLYHGEVLFAQGDVSKLDEVTRVAESVINVFGKVDILVNNAGIEYNDRGNILEMPFEDLTRILDVNLMGYINVVRSFIPSMKSGGRVINVSSVQGLTAHLPGTSYQVSKAGILGLTRALSIELASRGITVNSIVPGAIKTEGMGNTRSADSSILDPYRRRIPAGRRGWPEEVAGPILFLASDMASYITGTTLVVDGGYLVNITPDILERATPQMENDPDR